MATDEMLKYSPTGCSASKSNYPTDVPLYQESRCRIRAMRSRGIEVRHGSPRSRTRHRGSSRDRSSGRGPLTLTRWPSSMITTPGLVSASWESVGRRDPTARLDVRSPHPMPIPRCPQSKCMRFCQKVSCPSQKVLLPAFSMQTQPECVDVIFNSCIV
jgi:hypothetical protein